MDRAYTKLCRSNRTKNRIRLAGNGQFIIHCRMGTKGWTIPDGRNQRIRLKHLCFIICPLLYAYRRETDGELYL